MVSENFDAFASHFRMMFQNIPSFTSQKPSLDLLPRESGEGKQLPTPGLNVSSDLTCYNKKSHQDLRGMDVEDSDNFFKPRKTQ